MPSDQMQSRADPGPDESTTEKAREAARHAGDAVAGSVGTVSQEASAQLSTVRDEAMTRAQDLLHEARGRATDQADQGTHQLADALVAAGNELTAMAESSDQDGPVTHAARDLGRRATAMGERLQQGGYRALAGDLKGFARERPGTFLLAAVGAGFAVGRIVRNADTKSIMQAAGADGSSDSGAESSSGAEAPDLILAEVGTIPADPTLREPPGIGPDELTGSVIGDVSATPTTNLPRGGV
jgi:hypothetical protein